MLGKAPHSVQNRSRWVPDPDFPNLRSHLVRHHENHEDSWLVLWEILDKQCHASRKPTLLKGPNLPMDDFRWKGKTRVARVCFFLLHFFRTLSDMIPTSNHKVVLRRGAMQAPNPKSWPPQTDPGPATSGRHGPSRTAC